MLKQDFTLAIVYNYCLMEFLLISSLVIVVEIFLLTSKVPIDLFASVLFYCLTIQPPRLLFSKRRYKRCVVAPLYVLSYMAKKKKPNQSNRENIFAINRPYRYSSFGLQTKRHFFVSILELNQVLTTFLWPPPLSLTLPSFSSPGAAETFSKCHLYAR